MRIKTKLSAINDRASVLFRYHIPTFSIGLAKGKISLDEEYIEIDSILKGVKQLLYILKDAEKLGEYEI